MVPLHISALFILLVFSIAFLTLMGVYVSSQRAKLPLEQRQQNFVASLLVISTWLIFTLIISVSGFLFDFSSRPPHVLLVTIPPLVFLVILFNAKAFITLTEQFNVFWLVYAQSFRILKEFILWLLARQSIIPEQMAMGGYNIDMFFGLTAPFVAYYCFAKKTWSLRIAFVWNIAGILSLANVVVLAVLSSPYPFREKFFETTNTLMFHYPFVWQPAFVVPFALLLHLIALRRIWKATA